MYFSKTILIIKTMEKEFKNYVNALTANTTYVVSEDCRLGTNLILPENVTLIFKGGIISFANGITLTGNRTSIIAPITKIFDATTWIVGSETRYNLYGTWNVDRAYPQWFGAKADNTTDCSDAINIAIFFKVTGEVFIPRGVYKITKTVEVKYGIVLCGEKAKNPVNMSNNLDGRTGTVLRPSSTGANFKGNFMIRINTNGTSPSNASWIQDWGGTITAVKNIFFFNDPATHIRGIKGILFAATVEISYCGWYNFEQAVASSLVEYIDNKKIVDCDSSCDDNMQPGELYAFELSGLGDSLCFQRNHVIHKKGFHIAQSNGADISNNILNTHILVDSCKGIVFSSNHCENIAQLSINTSSITIDNCFFQKNNNHSITISGTSVNDISTVSLNNCNFLYYDYSRSGNNQIDGVANEYDIHTSDGLVSLKITNSFRFYVTRGSIGKAYAFGLSISTNNQNNPDPMPSFNHYSYFLSNDGLVKPKKFIGKNNAIQTTTNVSLYGGGDGNSGIIWQRQSNTNYNYTYQIIWDLNRCIALTYNSNNKMTYTARNGGSILLVGYGELVGYQAFIRVFREGGGRREYVDIPICGTEYLHDNGNSICGFKWKDQGNIDHVLRNVTVPVGAVEFKGENVVLRASSQPASGTWTNGDIVYNTNTSSSNALWIRSNNSWLSK